jgi:F-type H+-transporting ATPase subunit b
MRAVVLFAFLLVLPGVSRAAGEGGSELRDFLWSVFNLGLLIAAIVYFARKPIRDYFAARRRQVGGELDAAAELLRDAEARLSEWQARVQQLDATLAEIRETARRRSEADRERILAQAHATADRIRRDAGAAVERELSHAREQLREEAAALAVELASGILQEKVTPADRKRLVEDFIVRVEQTPSGSVEG